MQEKINAIMDIMNSIEYGFHDDKGFNLIQNQDKWDTEFNAFYYLLTPIELLHEKCGTCWDQVELERYLFQKENIDCNSYFICTYDNDHLPCHTFITYKKNDYFYWFEHSWKAYQGIHKYHSLTELFLDVKKKFIENNSKDICSDFTFIYEYTSPKAHITCKEFYEYMETQKLIKINKPLYFYHLVNKNADLRKGLLSLQYMYDHKMYEMFDHYISKYQDRITNSWNIEKYKNKKVLTREELIDGLNLFRGKYGSSYIYFFRYPPYEGLGPKMKDILKYKDIYRINIQDEEVMKKMKDIFYGYDRSHTDCRELTKTYYEKITKEEYFKKYEDSLKMNFSTLNHIGISFIDDYCPIEFLEKIN